MEYLTQIKNKFEAYSCPKHGINPAINIIGLKFEILTCCKNFGDTISKLIDNQLTYDSLNKEVDRIENRSVPRAQVGMDTHPYIKSAVNHINEKRYSDAINILEDLIDNSDHSDYFLIANAHIGLVYVYCKDKESEHFNIEKANYHAKMALIFGERNGLAAYTLVENLERRGNYHQAIELCKLLIGPGYRFHDTSILKKHDYGKILERLRSKINKATDDPGDQLFTEGEKYLIKMNSNRS